MNPSPRLEGSPASSSGGDLAVVVVGTSAGGTAALKSLVAQLPPDLPACVLAVQHVAPEVSVERLAQAIGHPGQWDCREAAHGDPLVAGRLYLAPADRHMLVDFRKVWVTKGPRENRWRPAVDTLFRSAAVTHGGRVVGVILTGALDDGAAGLLAVRRCGGVCLVQDPKDALFPDMPLNAMKCVEVDRCVPLAAIGGTIAEVVAGGPRPSAEPPHDLVAENRVALGGQTSIEDMDALGSRSGLTCPECGGGLWEVGGNGAAAHFRCHTGHAFTADALENGISLKIEETLWAAVRLFEERKRVIESVSRHGTAGDGGKDRILEIESHLALLRNILAGPDTGAK